MAQDIQGGSKDGIAVKTRPVHVAGVDSSGIIRQILVDSDGHVQLDVVSTSSADFAPILQADEALNDSDKTFTVTASKQWHIWSIWVEFTSTATVGNRQLVIEIQDDSSDVIAQVVAGAVQAESLTRNYLFAPGNADLLSFRDTNFMMTPIPSTFVLPSGYVIRVYDNNAVDATADDMVVQMLVGERDA